MTGHRHLTNPNANPNRNLSSHPRLYSASSELQDRLKHMSEVGLSVRARVRVRVMVRARVRVRVIGLGLGLGL